MRHGEATITLRSQSARRVDRDARTPSAASALGPQSRMLANDRDANGLHECGQRLLAPIPLACTVSEKDSTVGERDRRAACSPGNETPRAGVLTIETRLFTEPAGCAGADEERGTTDDVCRDEVRGRVAPGPVAGRVRSAAHGCDRARVDGRAAGGEAGRRVPVSGLPGRAVPVRDQVRLALRLAQLLLAGRLGRRRAHRGPQLRDGAYGGALRELRLPPGSRLRRRAADSDRRPLLHELDRAQLRGAVSCPG